MNEYYEKLHKKIAKELNLQPSQVQAIRSAVARGETIRDFGLRMFSRAGLKRYAKAGQQFKTRRRNSKAWHLQIYKFTQNITYDQRSTLLQD